MIFNWFERLRGRKLEQQVQRPRLLSYPEYPVADWESFRALPPVRATKFERVSFHGPQDGVAGFKVYGADRCVVSVDLGDGERPYLAMRHWRLRCGWDFTDSDLMVVTDDGLCAKVVLGGAREMDTRDDSLRNHNCRRGLSVSFGALNEDPLVLRKRLDNFWQSED